MIIFVLLSAVLFALGLGGRRCLVAGVALMVILPFSNGFSDYTYQSGAYAYDFFFIASGLRMFVSWTLRGKITRVGGMAMPVVLAIVAYSCFYHHWEGLTYFLKDYRPAIFALEALALAWRVKVLEGAAMSRSAALLLVTSGGVASVAWMLFSLSGIVVHQDVFYDQNSYRYLGVSTYLAVVYLVYHLSPLGAEDAKQNSRQQYVMQKLAFASSVAALLVCGGRTLIAALALVVVITNSTSFRRFIMTSVMSLGLLVLFVTVSEYFGADRVAQSMNSGGAQAQFLTRFSPAFDRIAEMRDFQYLVGLGFGTTFEIPWFDYRGLDTDNTFVDCAYLTFYVKYGVIGLGMLLGYYAWQSRTFLSQEASRRLSLPLFLLVASLCVTYAVPYQSVAPGLLIGYVVIACLNRSRMTRSMPVSRSGLQEAS